MLWLALVGAVWVLLSPSVMSGERMHHARTRVLLDILHDPLFYVSLVIAAFAACRWANSSVDVVYDYALSDWRVARGVAGFLPAAAVGSGYFEFSCSIAFVVLMQGCRHAIGRGARFFYILLCAILAGVSAVVALTGWSLGTEFFAKAASCPRTGTSFIGTAYMIYSVAAVYSVVSAFEYKWRSGAFTLVVLSGALMAAAFVFSPETNFIVLASVIVLSLASSLPFAVANLKSSALFKCVFSYLLVLTSATLLLFLAAEDSFLLEKVSFLTGEGYLSDALSAQRKILSAASFRIWSENIWLGCGIDAFRLELPFVLSDEAQIVVPVGQASPINGWWHVLVERGLVGAILYAVVLGFLLWSFFSRFVNASIRSFSVDDVTLRESLSHCFFMPVVIVAALVCCAFTDSSLWGADVLLPVCGFIAVASRSIRVGELIGKR